MKNKFGVNAAQNRHKWFHVVADIKPNRDMAKGHAPVWLLFGSFASVHYLPEQVLHVHLPVDEVVEAVNADAFLLHGVAVADGHAVVGERVVVHGDAGIRRLARTPCRGT